MVERFVELVDFIRTAIIDDDLALSKIQVIDDVNVAVDMTIGDEYEENLTSFLQLMSPYQEVTTLLQDHDQNVLNLLQVRTFLGTVIEDDFDTWDLEDVHSIYK